ncbi:hypothetical protein IMPJCBKJ_01839 [Pseudoalteromonas sp. MB47]|nr:hypothetical protein [Pseudoalteromonas sp. MB47]
MKMKLLKYNRGMTLIEVLIASVILFIAISAMSYVTRSTSLHEMRLSRHIDRALLGEFVKDYVAYQYQYNDSETGSYTINNSEFTWQVTVLDEKPPLRSISNEISDSDNQNTGNLILYEIQVKVKNEEKVILRVKDVYWKN